MSLSDGGGHHVHPTLMRRPAEPERTDSMRLKIIADGVVYIDGRARRCPAKGDAVEVGDPAVANTLLHYRKAEPEGGPPPEPEMAESVGGGKEPPGKPAATEVQVSGLPGGTGHIGDPPAWSDIPGISEASRTILVEKGQYLDPRSVTPEQLETVLGSKQRTSFVVKALDAFFEPAAGG